ncbi:MAG TPA: EAL domain-containing protein [Geminicoccaceae bacterium]|nr:EAL domain-containing protein [Geminicoccus sp.]HMU52031.1 EAL domain-containing protein [Geminicoccaceae bacterium]
MIRQRSPPARLGATLIAFILVTLLADWSGITRGTDRWLYDRVAARLAPPPPPDVLIVAIDEASLSSVGRWPWPRRVHAELVRRLASRGASVVGIDVIFAEPDIMDPAGDELLAAAISAGNVVLPLGPGRLHDSGTEPLEAFAAGARLGHSALTPDDDGRLRRFLLVEDGHPSLPVAMLRSVGRDPPTLDQAWLPLPPGPSAIRHMSAADVLAAEPAARDLDGVMVLVGITAPGLAPRVAWPDAPAGVAAVEVQAAALSVLHQGRLITGVAEPGRTGLVLALSALVGLAIGRSPPGRLLPALALAVAAAGPVLLLVLDDALMPLTAPAVGALAGIAVCALVRWLGERRELRSAQRRAQVVLSSIADGVIVVDAAGAVDFANPAAERMLDVGGGGLIGRPIGQVLELSEESGPTDVSRFLGTAAVSSGLTLSDSNGRRRSIRLTTAPMGRGHRAAGTVLALSDVTVERELMREISHRAHHDGLTGLPNRVLLRDRLESALARARRSSACGAVVMLDVDRFKAINDALGHAAGDALLHAMAQRLASAKRDVDTLSRIGGDEFVLVLELASESDALAATERYREALAAPFTVDGHALHVTASFGISLFPRDADDPDQLLRNADLAMYRAKHTLPGSIQFFAEEMNARARERLALEHELRLAVARREFELHYQPQLAIDRRRLVGVECLVRWRHPTRGLLPPASFVQVAEENGLICDIGRQVLVDGCSQLRTWSSLDPSLRLSVNLSVVQLKADDGLVDFVAGTMQRAGLDCSLLELEVTEGLFLDPRLDMLSSKLRELTEAGVKLSIDDFGTGYSSLAYLRHFPFDRIKIDRTFVKDVEEDEQACAIVRSIIGLGHSLGKPITAEGVETEAQLGFLQRERCDEAQGYLLGKPGDAASIDRWLH